MNRILISLCAGIIVGWSSNSLVHKLAGSRTIPISIAGQAHLISVKNNGSEVAYVDKDGRCFENAISIDCKTWIQRYRINAPIVSQPK